MTSGSPLPPVVKRVHIDLPLEAAFRRFTDEIHTWWPMATHSVAAGRAATVVLEGWEGGRLFEREDDGTTHEWGRIVTWEPPHRVAFTWHPGRQSPSAQHLSVAFTVEGDGTSAELTHGGWEVLGDDAAAVRGQYDQGWLQVLELFARSVSS
jgi:uncharacterized protein YndB with AHSA1/START domain